MVFNDNILQLVKKITKPILPERLLIGASSTSKARSNRRS